MMQGAMISTLQATQDFNQIIPTERQGHVHLLNVPSVNEEGNPLRPPDSTLADPNLRRGTLAMCEAARQPPAPSEDPNLGAPASKSQPPAPTAITTLLTLDCNLLNHAKATPL